MKTAFESALSAGWHAEAFARQKRLKDLSEYLKTPTGRTREQSAMDVKRMFDRMIEKGA